MANLAQPNVRSRSGDTMPPKGAAQANAVAAGNTTVGGQGVTLVLAWLAVGLPLLWGVLQTLQKTLALFK
jgi:hypothetical protein